MQEFNYQAPRTLEDAIALLSEAAARGERSYPLAGGTNLLPQLKEGLITPALVVNLKRIPGLRAITVDEQGLHLGPLVTAAELIRSPLVQAHCPVLAQAAATMAGVQVRNIATLGGNLCNASPAGDLAPSLIAVQAVAEIRGANGVRLVPLDGFFTGPGRTVLAPGELLTRVTVPATETPISAVYLKHALRQAMAISVVGVAAALERRNGVCRDARIALGAVAPTPVRSRQAEDALRDRPLTPETIDNAARLAAADSRPIDDLRNSAWYRRRIVEVLTRRALQQLA